MCTFGKVAIALRRTFNLVTMVPHRHLLLWRFAILLICNSILLRSVECFSPLWDSVKTNVFQEYEINQPQGQTSVVRMRLNAVKKPDLIVGENVKQNSRLILTCTAWYPAEWVYSGDAEPTYYTNITIENLGPWSKTINQGEVPPLDDMNGAKRYIATIVIGPRGIKQSDTGRYNCMTASPETGMKFKTLSAFYHLFVPGKSLFIRKRGGTIMYDLRKSPARIPCGVTNPKIAVSLQKFQNGRLVNVDNDTMLYHPVSGFYPRQDIPGTYVCTAAFNRAFELLHFTLVPKVSGSVENFNQASDEDLEWLFNSFKLGNSNRIRLSTKRPVTHVFSSEKRKETPKPEKLATQGSPASIWNRPEANEDNDEDDPQPPQSSLVGGARPTSNYRPVYVLFAEDLNKLQKTTERPSGSGSGSASASASASASEESEEEEEKDNENEGDGAGAEAEESGEEKEREREREPDHQYHFDTQENSDPGSILEQLLSTKRPVRLPPSRPSMRPSLHHQYQTTYLPFIDFLNPGAAVVKYKPVANPGVPMIASQYADDNRRTTPRPYAGHIVYDLNTNKLLYDITRATTSLRPLTTRRPTSLFKIPSLPTQRWPTTRKTKATTRRTTTTTTTPPPPLIPDAVVCINSPCGKNAKCYANTVYYHKQKETRREPACKCNDNYYGNPYLECQPPSPVEHDFLSFNNSDLFERRSGEPPAYSMEEGQLHSDVFHSSSEHVIVDAKKK